MEKFYCIFGKFKSFNYLCNIDFIECVFYCIKMQELSFFSFFCCSTSVYYHIVRLKLRAQATIIDCGTSRECIQMTVYQREITLFIQGQAIKHSAVKKGISTNEIPVRNNQLLV